MQASYPTGGYIYFADSCHGNAVHARVGVSSLDPKRHSGQHLLTGLRRSVAKPLENGEPKLSL